MKRPNLLPRGKWIFVQQDPEQSRESAHGIYTPDNVEQEKKAFGIVLAVGKEISDIEIGARVVYGLYAGETVQYRDDDGKTTDFKLLHDDDVIAFDLGIIEVQP